MRLKLIACKALTREMCHICAVSGNNVDITYIRQRYHDTPENLRKILQSEINSVEGGDDPHTNAGADFDAVLIGYGLCSNGISGIYCKKYPLVVPRAHDCISMYLGSKERYARLFREMPGTYWYTASWVECYASKHPSPEEEIEAYRRKGYDEEDIEYLLEESRAWVKNYNYGAYIRTPFYNSPQAEKTARDAAENFGWQYREVDGSLALFSAFAAGDWDDDAFLVVPPGNKIVPSYDEKIIKCLPLSEL